MNAIGILTKPSDNCISGENENRLPWYFQISALHFSPSLQLNGPVLNGKVCFAFCSPVDTEMAFWAATLVNMFDRVGFLFEQLATAVTPMRQRKWLSVLKYCGGNAFIIQ